MRHKIVGIIGGKGLMGRFFADFFKKLGFRVLISDIKTKLSNKKLVKKSDIVFFSVPIHLTEKIIKSVLAFTRPDQLLFDCTSLKTIPIRTMLKSQSSVVGLHPMFRPGKTGFKNQTIVMCPARADKKTVADIEKWLKDAGAKIVKMTAEEHDRLMSIIQVLVHFHTIVLGNAFRKLKVPIKKTFEVASPIYKLEINMIARIFSQNPLLYAAIEMFNPETTRVTKVLLAETQKLAKTVFKKDMKKFAKEFNTTANFLGGFKKQAFEEINQLLTK